MRRSPSNLEVNRKAAAIQKWLGAPWPKESLDAQYKYGCLAGRLYPFLRLEVLTPDGKGKLVQVFERRAAVVFDGEDQARFFLPWEVLPAQQVQKSVSGGFFDNGPKWALAAADVPKTPLVRTGSPFFLWDGIKSKKQKQEGMTPLSPNAPKKHIVAHGDLDGVVSAALLAKRNNWSLDDVKTTFTQPFSVNQVAVGDDDEVYVVDIAINNRDPQMTQDFIVRLGPRLVRWYDHHAGWGADVENDPRFIVKDAPSCASIVGGDPALAADADAADTRKGTLSDRGQLIESAMKADLANDAVREAAFRWLMGDESARAALDGAARRYAAVVAETERLASGYRVDGSVAVVDARESNHNYDLTQLLLAGQKKARFAAALVRNPRDGGERVTIATQDKSVNLVSVFGLQSGAPFRVTLPAEQCGDALARLNALSEVDKLVAGSRECRAKL